MMRPYISLLLIGLLLFSPLAEAQSVNIDPLVQALRGRQGALVYENAKDAAGNVISRTSNGKSYRYVYDEENRLIEVWENNTKRIEMAYGYAGNRLRKEVDLGAGRKIRTTYLGSVQIHESVVNGTVTERSVTTHVGGDLTSTRGTLGNNQTTPLRGPSAGDHYFLRDHLGSQVMELNSTGAIVSRSTYEPYGQLFIQGQNGSVGRQQNRGYTGQELDENGGLMYYGARYYDTGAGRFMSKDSMVPEAKDAQSWNGYAYVRNNPIKFTDPTGHEEFPIMLPGEKAFGAGSQQERMPHFSSLSAKATLGSMAAGGVATAATAGGISMAASATGWAIANPTTAISGGIALIEGAAGVPNATNGVAAIEGMTAGRALPSSGKGELINPLMDEAGKIVAYAKSVDPSVGAISRAFIERSIAQQEAALVKLAQSGVQPNIVMQSFKETGTLVTRAADAPGSIGIGEFLSFRCRADISIGKPIINDIFPRNMGRINGQLMSFDPVLPSQAEATIGAWSIVGAGYLLGSDN